MFRQFRKRYSTIDHIHTISQAIEKRTDYDQPLSIAFIDHEKAFGCVETSAATEALWNQVVDEPYAKILEDIYSGSTATIAFHKESNMILIKKDVRQGDTIYPMLFTTCLQKVFRAFDWEHLGIRADAGYLSNLLFTEDIVLVSNSQRVSMLC